MIPQHESAIVTLIEQSSWISLANESIEKCNNASYNRHPRAFLPPVMRDAMTLKAATDDMKSIKL